MTGFIEAARDICGLTGLRDPILFERLVHHSERRGIDQAHSTLSQSYPNVMTLEQWVRDFEPAVVGAMKSALGLTPEPNDVAAATLQVFRDALARRAVAHYWTCAVLAHDADFSALHKAAAEARRILVSLGEQSMAVVFFTFEDRGMSLPVFQAALTELVKITEGSLLDTKLDPGRRSDSINKSMLTTGCYLMEEHGLKRKQAARVLAAMFDAHPDFKAKTADTIEQAIRNAQIRNA